MNSDKFSNTRSSDVISDLTTKKNNFFLNSDAVSVPVSTPEPLRHLNDYDSNILQEGAYRDVQDTLFKLEYKITRAESKIKELNEQLKTAEEIKDEQLVLDLTAQKLQMEKDLKNLTTVYKDASLSAKISGKLTSKKESQESGLDKFFKFLETKVASKLPKKLINFITIRNSLNMLESINKNVDELIKNKYPYGEAGEKYEQLTKYIARANTIQLEIAKYMK